MSAFAGLFLKAASPLATQLLTFLMSQGQLAEINY